MPRRKTKGRKGMKLSRSNMNESAVTEEIALREARKNLIKAGLMFYESKPTQQMHPKPIVREEDCLSPWYFCHT